MVLFNKVIGWAEYMGWTYLGVYLTLSSRRYET